LEVKDIISSGLLELHVTGLTSAAEREQVEKWVMQYPEVKSELNDIEISLEYYAMAHAIEPGESTKKNILQNLSPMGNPAVLDAVPAKLVSIAPFWKYAAAASIILLLGSAVLNFIYYDRLQKTSAAYQQAQDELYAVNDQMKGMSEDLGVVKNKFSQPVALNGLPASPEAAAKIFWMKNTGEVYIDPSNLPDAPQGMQYQLWGIVDGKPVDAGLIITTQKENKFRILKMKSFGKIKVQAFAVTLETAGGNTTPKGEMYVMGTTI
jgi:anti-sigma-K factor RskA